MCGRYRGEGVDNLDDNEESEVSACKQGLGKPQGSLEDMVRLMTKNPLLDKLLRVDQRCAQQMIVAVGVCHAQESYFKDILDPVVLNMPSIRVYKV